MHARLLQPELMDDPALDSAEHLSALCGLARLNRISRTAAALWPHIAACPHTPAPSILDVATGSGDVLIALALRARRSGRELNLTACDISPVALQAAADRARRADVRLILEQRNFVADGLDCPDASFDIVMCSLFLHHLTEPQSVTVLSEMRRIARHTVLVSDLCRCHRGLWAAAAAARLFSRSRVVRIDAVRSVRAAFTPAELRSLADPAGLLGAHIRPCWPVRMLMVWNRP